MTVKERLYAYATANNLTIAQAEKLCGLGRNAFKNAKGMNVDAVATFLENCPDVSAEWLMRGKIDGNALKEEMINVMQNNGVNTGTMSNSTKSNDYSVLLKEKDERISELKERIAELKETIELLKSK